MTPSSTRSPRAFHQLSWGDAIAAHVRASAVAWFAEDLGHECDWTTVGLISASAGSDLAVVARKPGVIAGLQAAAVIADVADPGLTWRSVVADGDAVAAGTVVAGLAGPTRSILAAERVILNVLGRMSGVATATRALVDAVAGTRCRVFDTRKTIPGWRLLDKYAVRMGGGWNHRLGLYDAILIKDNHRAALAAEGINAAEAVRRARAFVERTFPPSRSEAMVVEIELDGLDDLDEVLRAGPDVILLDNMDAATLARAVAQRELTNPDVALEASGGVSPETVAGIARTGVDRVSTGWPTHHAPWLDLALDWPESSRR
jgi:nicotinate-nucleotide pyrophosphorylase (carboxylating)